jgi:hypothetical protein
VKSKKTPDPIQETEEEERQLRDLEAEHPWNLTLRQFLARIEADYGLRLVHEPADAQAGKIEILYLWRTGAQKPVHLPGVDLDEQLDPFATVSLCRRLGIPPEDFGLNPKGPYGADRWED